MRKELFGKWAFIVTPKKRGIVNIDGFPARIVFEDLGWLRDYKVFDVMEARENIVFHLDDHLGRLGNSYYLSSITCFPADISSKVFLEKAIKKALNKNGFKSSLVKIFLTGGWTNDGFHPKNTPNIYILISPFSRPKLKKDDGSRLTTLNYSRQFPDIKNTDYFAAEINQKFLITDGYDDVLYCPNHDFVLETAQANFFVVKDGIIIAPFENILLGVTRKIILNLAGKNGFKIEQRLVRPEDICNASEAFITCTSKGVWPVIKIENKVFPVGPITLRLRNIFEKYRKEYFKERGIK